MKYLYHFHAQCQQINAGIEHADGTIISDEKVKNHEQYLKAKKEVAKAQGFDISRTTLCNLSLLCEIP